MDLMVERCAGVDIGEDEVVACVRTPDPAGKDPLSQAPHPSPHLGVSQRIQKTLEDAGIKLDSVASDALGVSAD